MGVRRPTTDLDDHVSLSVATVGSPVFCFHDNLSSFLHAADAPLSLSQDSVVFCLSYAHELKQDKQ